MQQATEPTSQTRTEPGKPSWFSLLSFSTALRNLTVGTPHKDVLRAIRTAFLADWRVDTATGTVSLVNREVSLSLFPKSTGQEVWLSATTRHGQLSLSRQDASADAIEKRLHRRVDGYRAQVARGISSKWVKEMALTAGENSPGWSVSPGRRKVESFGAASYNEREDRSFTTITPSGLYVSVYRVDHCSFISVTDAYRNYEYGGRGDGGALRSKINPLIPTVGRWGPLRPVVPLEYGYLRGVTLSVLVRSTSLDNLTQAVGLKLGPVATACIERDV